MSVRALSWALEQDGLSPTDKLVLIAMADSAGDSGRSYSSYRTILRITGHSREDTINEAQKRLVDLGKLVDTGERTGSTGRVKVWQLHPDACKESSPEIEAMFNSRLNGGLPNHEILRQSSANPPPIPGLTGNAYIKGTRNGEQPTGSLAKKPFPEVPPELATPEFQAAWADWLKDRRDRRKPVTAEAAKRQLSQCAEWGAARAVQAINASIQNGWQGLFEPKEQRQPFQRPAFTPRPGPIMGNF